MGKLGLARAVAIVRRAADIMEARRGELAAISVLETAKSRMEAFGEVDELIGLLRLNCEQVEENEGFRYRLPGDGTGSNFMDVLRPYGVWGLISPFNFPLALAANPVSAALLAGNCLVFKPAHQGVLTGLMIYDIFRQAGIPGEAFHVLPGPGAVVGARIAGHPDVDGITFTGSYDVGMVSIAGVKECRGDDLRARGKNPSVVWTKWISRRQPKGSCTGRSGSRPEVRLQLMLYITARCTRSSSTGGARWPRRS